MSKIADALTGRRWELLAHLVVESLDPDWPKEYTEGLLRVYFAQAYRAGLLDGERGSLTGVERELARSERAG